MPPSNHQTLPPVHVGHLQAPARKALHQALDDVGMLDEGKANHVCQRIARHVIVGRPEAAGQDDQVGALERAPQMLADLAPVVADNGLRPQLDAERAQSLREHERVRIEPRRSQQLAADRDDLGRLQRRARRSCHPSRKEGHQQPQRHVRVDGRHRVVRHDTEAAVQRLEAARRKWLDDVEDRKRKKPVSAALSPTGMNASVISIPTTSSSTIGPGSVPPK